MNRIITFILFLFISIVGYTQNLPVIDHSRFVFSQEGISSDSLKSPFTSHYDVIYKNDEIKRISITTIIKDQYITDELLFEGNSLQYYTVKEISNGLPVNIMTILLDPSGSTFVLNGKIIEMSEDNLQNIKLEIIHKILLTRKQLKDLIKEEDE